MAWEEPIVLEIPFEVRSVRLFEGAQVDVLAFVDLWTVRYADGSVQQISNPLNDVALKGRAEDAPPTRIFFKLVPSNYSNPGLDDNGQSLTYDHWRTS